MFFNNDFILASTSKSRYTILKNTGLNFSKKKPLCNEAILQEKMIKKKQHPKLISLQLARLKSKSINNIKNKLIVGSDTVIFLDNKIIKKAKNIYWAKEKIKRLSGKNHEVYSSVSVFFNNKEVWKTTKKTTIKIRKLSDEEIDKYLCMTGKQILGSVGCYQVEALGPYIIENIKGDFFNVMGFPLFPFLKFLKRFNIKK